MDIQTPSESQRIRELNDRFRTTFVGGAVTLTVGVAELSQDVRKRVLLRVRTFKEFDDDNDPHGEHDMAIFPIDGIKYAFKIDYYDKQLEAHSPNPTDPSVTTRVMTVMRADEY